MLRLGSGTAGIVQLKITGCVNANVSDSLRTSFGDWIGAVDGPPVGSCVTVLVFEFVVVFLGEGEEEEPNNM